MSGGTRGEQIDTKKIDAKLAEGLMGWHLVYTEFGELWMEGEWPNEHCASRVDAWQPSTTWDDMRLVLTKVARISLHKKQVRQDFYLGIHPRAIKGWRDMYSATIWHEGKRYRAESSTMPMVVALVVLKALGVKVPA